MFTRTEQPVFMATNWKTYRLPLPSSSRGAGFWRLSFKVLQMLLFYVHCASYSRLQTMFEAVSIETLLFYDFPVNLQPVRKTKELKQSMHYNLAAPVETFCQGTKDAVWRLII